MEDNKITREVYKAYADKIVSVLDKEGFYEQFKNRVEKGSSVFKLAKKRLIQDISIDWIDTIESILPNLDTIVRNPRKFIVQEEDIVDVSLARSISTESVKYLAQHTNMISKVDEKTGDVTPSKILNITKEESFEIYENRFIYTLLLKLKDFVTMRYDKIKKASATQDVLELDIESRFNLPSKKITYRTEYFAQLSFDEVMRLDPDTLTKIERVAKIDRIITDFLSSSFAKSMRNSAPVRPPIMRTNVILKEPNFKKALTLWQFVETYQATAGFSTSDEVEEYDIEDDSAKRLRSMITLNTMVFESLYDQCETDFDMEDKEFADFMRVGQMDFQKDEIERDEYAQKLDNKEENEEEQENIEEVKPQEEEDADKEIPPELEEKEPEIEEQEVEKEVEKPLEIEKEVVVERPVEVERFKEMPPKADQEEVDLEPDAEKFDQHLFEVRKIFKRPDDDKIKQEEIIKVKDAIDRCLTSYRRIKQEELEERDRQERIRRRREDIEKRAAAFKKQREELEKNGANLDDSALGMDPFSYQKAKIAREKSEEEARKRKEAIKFDKRENLELEDKDTQSINKSIDEMEKARAAKAERDARIDEHLDSIDAIMPLENDIPIVSRVRKKRDYSIAKQTAQLAQNGGDSGQNGARTTENVGRKPSIRLAKDAQVNPWGEDGIKKRRINITPVDENKVAVGEVHVKDDDKPVLWGGNTDLGKIEHAQTEQKPKRKYTRKSKSSDADIATENSSRIDGISTVNEQNTAQEGAIKPVLEMHINIGGKIENTDGMGISFKGDDRPVLWGGNANLGKIEHSDETPKTKRKYTRKNKEKAVENTTETDVPTGENNAENAANINEKSSKNSVKKAEKSPENDVKISGKTAENQQENDDIPQEKQPENKQSDKPARKKKEKKDPWSLSATTLNQKYTLPSGKERHFDAVDEDKVAVGGIRFKKGSGILDPFGQINVASVAERKSDNGTEKAEKIDIDNATLRNDEENIPQND